MSLKPEIVGISKNNLVLGKHFGRHALNAHIREMGYKLSDEELNKVFKKFESLADKKKKSLDEDIEALINEGVLRSSNVFTLEYIHVLSGNTVYPTASIVLNINGCPVQGATEGSGPIDAVYNIISKLTETKSELLCFTISALTEDTDALGVVTVRLKEDGMVAMGKGADPDIITASALSYINGLNRLEYMKTHPPKEQTTL